MSPWTLRSQSRLSSIGEGRQRSVVRSGQDPPFMLSVRSSFSFFPSYFPDRPDLGVPPLSLRCIVSDWRDTHNAPLASPRVCTWRTTVRTSFLERLRRTGVVRRYRPVTRRRVRWSSCLHEGGVRLPTGPQSPVPDSEVDTSDPFPCREGRGSDEGADTSLPFLYRKDISATRVSVPVGS